MWSLAVLPGEPRTALFRTFRLSTLSRLVAFLAESGQIERAALLDCNEQVLQQKLLVIISNYYSCNQHAEVPPELVGILLALAVGPEPLTSHKAWVCLGNISNQFTARELLLGEGLLIKALDGYDLAAHADELLYVLAILVDNLSLTYSLKCLPFVNILDNLYSAETNPKNQITILMTFAELFKQKDPHYFRDLLDSTATFFRRIFKEIIYCIFPTGNISGVCVFLK